MAVASPLIHRTSPPSHPSTLTARHDCPNHHTDTHCAVSLTTIDLLYGGRAWAPLPLSPMTSLMPWMGSKMVVVADKVEDDGGDGGGSKVLTP
ncbi:hypothetical protein EE612_059217 [Oryza sativa]|nr:hypothetical protein EE612_059217 [Oryza sativa]